MNDRKLRKLSILLLVFIMMMNQMEVYAITAGGSSQTEYNSEGKCESDDLNSSTELVTEFLYWLNLYSDATIKFNYKGNRAWEQDLKPGAWSNDSIDDVNVAIFAGHGYKIGRNGLAHNALHYYTLNSYTNFHTDEAASSANLTTTEAKWGRKGTATRWVITYTCNFLHTSDSSYNSMMQGINIMMGFSSTVFLNSKYGRYLGMDMGLGSNIIDSFLNDTAKHQLSNEVTYAKVIYAENARDDTIKSYAYPNKPEPIGGSTKYYSITREIPAK